MNNNQMLRHAEQLYQIELQETQKFMTYFRLIFEKKKIYENMIKSIKPYRKVLTSLNSFILGKQTTTLDIFSGTLIVEQTVAVIFICCFSSMKCEKCHQYVTTKNFNGRKENMYITTQKKKNSK